jgi:hypothetical protein
MRQFSAKAGVIAAVAAAPARTDRRVMQQRCDIGASIEACLYDQYIISLMWVRSYLPMETMMKQVVERQLSAACPLGVQSGDRDRSVESLLSPNEQKLAD